MSVGLPSLHATGSAAANLVGPGFAELGWFPAKQWIEEVSAGIQTGKSIVPVSH